MITIQRISYAVALAAVLGGCGSAGEPQAEPPPVEETAFGDMVGTMDKARAVESTMQQHKDALDKSIADGAGEL